MKITCAFSQNVPYTDNNGVLQLCTLRPGKHNYPMLQPKGDPVLSETLRVLRKHGKVLFDDLLPSDQDILKTAPPGVDKTEYLAEKVLLKPSPKGRKVSKKTKKKVTKKSNAGGSKSKDKPATSAWKKTDDSGKPGKVSD